MINVRNIVAKAALGATLGMSALCAAGLAGTAQADPVTVSAGATQLPMSGLVIDLPANPAITYRVSGSWSLDDAAPSYDARDIIDEFDASNSIVAGNWVMIGYFTAGGCEGVLNGEKLDSSWMTDATLFGETWKVRGGVYTFNGELGRRPAAMLCRSNAAGQSVLLYRYLVNQPETLGQSDIMADVARSKVLASASKSYTTGRSADILPLRRSETRNRGKTDATRTMTLPLANLSVTFPDDGYVWLVEKSEVSDFITRMAPSVPEVGLELMPVAGVTCEGFLGELTDERPDLRARNIPTGWQTGPTLIADGAPELTLCWADSAGIRMVGLFLPEGQTDISSLNPIITALGNAK